MPHVELVWVATKPKDKVLSTDHGAHEKHVKAFPPSRPLRSSVTPMLLPLRSQLLTALPPAFAFHPQLGLAQSQYRVAKPSPPLVTGGNRGSLVGPLCCGCWGSEVVVVSSGMVLTGGVLGVQRPQVSAQ